MLNPFHLINLLSYYLARPTAIHRPQRLRLPPGQTKYSIVGLPLHLKFSNKIGNDYVSFKWSNLLAIVCRHSEPSGSRMCSPAIRLMVGLGPSREVHFFNGLFYGNGTAVISASKSIHGRVHLLVIWPVF